MRAFGASSLFRAGLVVCLAVLTLPASRATNGYQLIGIGQTQKSMGGSVTAAPLDAMTAITNPAGLLEVGARLDFSMEAFMPTRSVDFRELGGEATEGGSELYGVPAFGWAARANGNERLMLGFGMYSTAGLGVDYGELLLQPAAPMGPPEDVTFDGYTAIAFWRLAPTVAYRVSESVDVGAALHVGYQQITIRQAVRSVPFWNDPADPMAGVTPRDLRLDLGRPTNQVGLGAGFGLIWRVSPKFSLGASYLTELAFQDGEYRVGRGDLSGFNGAVGAAGTYELSLDFPQQLAVGFAYRPRPGFVVALDVKWIEWSATHDEVPFDGPTDAFDTNGDGVGDASSTSLEFGWDDQVVFAAGLQIPLAPTWNLRLGANYSRSPVEEADVFRNLVFPAVVERHASIGIERRWDERWAVSVTYMRAFEETFEGRDDVPSGLQALTPFGADSDARISLEEDTIGVQLTYRL
jgi:long-chain fatty acid transport protein